MISSFLRVSTTVFCVLCVILEGIPPASSSPIINSTFGAIIGQSMRSGITIYNEASTVLYTAVEKELFTDSDAWFALRPGARERWGRKAGTYKVWLKFGGRPEFNIYVAKRGIEVLVVVRGHGFDNIETLNAVNVWRA